jgi:hypothetical protein
MLDKCRNCGFELDPCENESHAGVCPRCGEPESNALRPVLRTPEDLAEETAAALQAGLNFVAGSTALS